MKSACALLIIFMYCNSISGQYKIFIYIYKCKQCDQSKIKSICKTAKDINDAYDKIIPYFNHNAESGEAFILKCENCPPGKNFMMFPSKTVPNPPKNEVLRTSFNDSILSDKIDIYYALGKKILLVDSTLFKLNNLIHGTSKNKILNIMASYKVKDKTFYPTGKTYGVTKYKRKIISQ